jgi:hypothetical protein
MARNSAKFGKLFTHFRERIFANGVNLHINWHTGEKLCRIWQTIIIQLTLLIWIEECVHEIVPVVLWDFEGFSLDGVEEGDEELLREVAPVVDTPVHTDKLVHRRLLL